MKQTPNGTRPALVPWLACLAALLFGANFLLFLHDQTSSDGSRMVWCPHHGWHSEGVSEDVIVSPVLLPFEGDSQVHKGEEAGQEAETTISDEENAVVLILQ